MIIEAMRRKVRKRVALAVAMLTGAVALFMVLVLVLVSTFGGAVQKSAGALADCLAPGVGNAVAGGPEPSASTRAEQVSNAKLIDAAAAKAGFSGQGSKIAIVTAMGESSLINLDYGDQVNGVRNPDGSPATSFGLFQQQTSQGWGTKEQVMNPEYATLSFLLGPRHDGKAGLSAVLHWEENTWISSVIHQVQRNSDRDHYTRFVGPAEAIIAEAGIDTTRPANNAAPVTPGGPGGAAGSTAAAGPCGGTAASVGAKDANDDYPFKAQTPGPGIYVEDPLGYYYGECTSFAASRLNRDAGTTAAPYKYTSAAGYQFGNAREWKAAWLARGWKVSSTPVPGAIAWWDAWGGGTPETPLHWVGENGHVAYVQSVTADGKAIIEEYNNTFYGPPGHKYSIRPEPVSPEEVNGFLYPPPTS